MAVAWQTDVSDSWRAQACPVTGRRCLIPAARFWRSRLEARGSSDDARWPEVERVDGHCRMAYVVVTLGVE